MTVIRWLLARGPHVHIGLVISGLMGGMFGVLPGIAFFCAHMGGYWSHATVRPLIRSVVVERLYARDRLMVEYSPPASEGNYLVSCMTLSVWAASFYAFARLADMPSPTVFFVSMLIPGVVMWIVWPVVSGWVSFRRARREVHAARNKEMDQRFWRVVTEEDQ